MRLMKGSYKDLVVTVYPGDEGSYELYEDDGVSQEYRNMRCAWISLSHKRSAGKHRIAVGKARGNYKGFVRNRSLEIRLPASVPPKAVKVGGRVLKWAFRLGDCGWTYDGDTATTLIHIPSFDIAKELTVDITEDKAVRQDAVLGLKGIMARLERVHAVTNENISDWAQHDDKRLPAEASQTGNRISRDPSSIAAELKRLPAVMKQIPAMINWMAKQEWGPGKSKAAFPKAMNILKAAMELM
jgi:alpha-glucosidase